MFYWPSNSKTSWSYSINALSNIFDLILKMTLWINQKLPNMVLGGALNRNIHWGEIKIKYIFHLKNDLQNIFACIQRRGGGVMTWHLWLALGFITELMLRIIFWILLTSNIYNLECNSSLKNSFFRRFFKKCNFNVAFN